jgi:hypothetical protein
MTPAGFPHSDTPGSTLGCQLPRAYRRLLRPSSALDAKASTMCPSQLVTHTTNPTPTTQPKPHNRDQTRDAHNQATKNHTHPHHNQMRACNIQTSNHTPTTPPPEPHPLPKKRTRTQHRAYGCAATRCSRPLSRSQTTTPHPNPHTPRCERPSRVNRSPKPHPPATHDHSRTARRQAA